MRREPSVWARPAPVSWFQLGEGQDEWEPWCVPWRRPRTGLGGRWLMAVPFALQADKKASNPMREIRVAKL